MKLLLPLILIISIALCFTNAYKPIDHKKINKLGVQECFNSGVNTLQSFNGGYIISAANLNVNVGEQESFFEQGFIDIDYENDQMFNIYQIEYNGKLTSGEVYAFGKNNTEYVVSTVNNEISCYTGDLSFALPEQYEMTYMGDLNIGTFPNEIFTVQSTSNLTVDTYMVSKVDCSVTSIFTQNTVGDVALGNSIENIFNYVPSSNPANYNLPSECFTNPNPISVVRAHNLRKSIKLPSILNH